MELFRSKAAEERYLAVYDARAARWPVPSEARLVETSYGRTFVRSSGPPDAPPLVLLPGVGSSSLMWAPNVAALSLAHRVHAVDNIWDHGRSEPARVVQTVEDFVAWLDGLLEALAPGRPVALMGISYGGWIALSYATRRPERLSSLVFVAPAGAILPLTLGFIVRAVLTLLPFRVFTRWLMTWLAADAMRAGGASRAFVEDALEEGFVAARSFRARRVVPPTQLGDEEWARLTVPSLFVVGAHEKIFDADLALARVARLAPAVERVRIEGAGHDVSFVPEGALDRAVLAFLSRRGGR